MSRRPVKHSVTLNGHRTSISLEDEFWIAFRELAFEKKMPINKLVSEIDVDRGTDLGLASAIRLYVLRELQAKQPQSHIDAR